jgi:hypothetical protein
MSIDDSFLLTSSSAAMSLCKRSPGRPRLPDDVRIANIRASKKAWADKHRPYVRAQIARLCSRPEYKARVRERYRLKREAWIAAGGIPGHRGRPRVDPPETAAGDACCAHASGGRPWLT